MRALLRRLWGRKWLKGAQFSSRYKQLDRLYMVADPWDLDSDAERARFAWSNALIARHAPDCARLLEVGCGEGRQTRELLAIWPDVSGLDVSPRAIARARERLPQVQFAVGRGEDVARLFADQRFDLVVAFEMLYYAAEPDVVLAALQKMSGRIIVSVFDGRIAPLRPLLESEGWSALGDFAQGDTRWHAFMWQRDQGAVCT